MAVKKPKEVKTITFIAEGKECVISDPDFKQICFGLSALKDASVGSMAEAGKVVYDVCMISCDKEIKEEARLLMSVCVDIATKYLLPVEVEIKKN